MSMPVITFFPSVAASSTASNWSSANIGVTLTQAPAMGGQGTIDRRVSGVRAGQPLEWARIVVEPERRPSVIQLAAAKGRGSCCPHWPVTDDFFRTQVRTKRDQLGEVADRVDGSDLLDAHEPVCIEVVPEEQRGVQVLGGEQPRAAVVQEVALVDSLDPERVPRFAERGEDRFSFLFLARAERRVPQGALLPRIGGDRLPEISRRSRQRPGWSGRSPRRRGRAR